MKTIVVGVDGSKQGEAALKVAAEEASLRGANLLVVSVWENPTLVAPLAAYATEAVKDFYDAAVDIVRKAVAEAADLQPQVPAEGKVIEGQPAGVLLKECERTNAEMLVVGSRGRGGFTSLMLGSVSQQLAHHAPCPVVIVR